MVLSAVMNLAGNFAAQIQKNVEALKKMQQSGNSTIQQLGNFGRQLDKVGSGFVSTGKTLTAAVTLPLAGIGAAALKAGMDFEAQLSSIKAVSGSTGAEMKQLSDLALKAGADTAFSAKDAARGIEELIKAGVSVKDILNGGLTGALSLATAGELELKDAAEIASTALNAFKSDNLSVSKAADILAGAANASATSVSELKFGLSSVAAVSSSVGMTFNDTSTALAVMAQNGLRGSDAGTSLKTMLMNLQPSTKAQRILFEQLGLATADGSSKFFTAQGKLKSLSDISGILNNSMKGLTDAQRLQTMETLFGSDAIRAANILYKESSKGVEDMKSAMSKVTAEQVAAEKLNNFKGSLEQLKGSLETAGITLAQTFLPHLREVADSLTVLVNKFSQMNPKTQDFIIKFALFAAAVGPVLWIVGALTSGIGGTITSITRLTSNIQKAGGVMAWLKMPTNLVVIGLLAIIAVAILLYVNWDKIVKIAKELSSKFIELKNNAIAKVKEEFQNLAEKVQEIKDKFIAFKNEAIENTIKKFEDFKKTLKDNQTEIKVTAGILGTVFGPALLVSGVKATIAAAQITAHFIASIIKTGTAAVINAAKITVNFIASMIKAGASAVVNGIKITASFIASMIAAGAEAVISGAKITISFIASLIAAAAQAIITSVAITGQLIVALISYAAQGWKTIAVITIQTALFIGQKVAMLASAAATGIVTAATWLFNAALLANPIVLVIAALALLGIAIYEIVKHWKEVCTWIEKAWNWLTTWNGTKAEDKSVTFTQTRIDSNQTIAQKYAEHTGKNALGTNYFGGGKTYVNEGNKGEILDLPKGTRIIPHDLSKKSLSGTNVIINMNGLTIREDADIDKIATALSKKLTLAGMNM